MKTKISRGLAARSLACIALVVALFGFSERPGGATVKVFLNDRLLFDQALHVDPELKLIELNRARKMDQVKVFFNNCGNLDNARSLALKDDEGHVVREWRFDDASDWKNSAMIFSVSEIPATVGTKKLHLQYTSRQLRDGLAIARVSLLADRDMAGR